ncbi:bifunctional lysylphosphatidylglycerol flippase/synthetase MprF [Labedaea rhizosphaerae]|uniref:Lysylphosphatidylglycerol synthetase-like protein (DUF2156 family) n=1 Tax=Labedaea rhizosphaerae TaxID=598644 RepID=A0A4R6SE61_LABRH|nr:DUF2156 domain-containing protein [Labedaea rhizosphaerae]TDP98182.1 lysylphosphatidylglycerol synthetase-like protein (DUF2156 family) [Labedaea rhizosphaerae]
MMKRYPLTLVSLATLWILSVLPHPESWWVGTGAPLTAGHWWGIFTSLGWCADWPSIVVTTALIGGLVPVAERTIGSIRATALLLGSQVLGQLAGLLLASAMVDTGGAWAYRLTDQVVVGPAGAVIGLGLATTAVLPVRWRRRLRITLVLGLAMFALYSGLLSDILRLTTGLAGLTLGRTLRGRVRAPRPSLPESRLLIAVLVAASAIGPLIAAIGRTRIGPLSVLRYVFTSPQLDPATVTQLCSDPLLLHHCAELHAQQRLSGLGPAIMSIIPVLVLLAAAEGLRRGRRAAWFTAVGTNLVLFALGIQLATRTAHAPAEQRLILGPGPHLHTWLVVGLPAVQPLLVVVLLALTRDRFAVRAPAGAYRRWLRFTGLTLASTAAVYVVGSFLLADDYTPAADLHRLLLDLPTRYLPPNYLGDLELPFQPTNFATTALYEWTGVVFWSVACVGALATFIRYEMSADRTDQVRVRRLLAETGGSSLAHLASWAGQSYWFSPDGRAAVAYRLCAGVAITTGEPIGDPRHHLDAVRGFLDHCARQGWTPCLYSVGEELTERITALGWHSVQVAEETVLSLPDLAFTGRKWQDVRTALNRADRAGIKAIWLRYREAPAEIADQIKAISAAWVAEKGLPEMGFTLGGLNELADDEVAVLVAVDGDGVVHGVTSWLPVHRDGVLIGRTLDFMRRRHEAFNGVMEFLIASAALQYKEQGLEFLSLSGAPLARLDRGEPVQSLQRLLEKVGRALEPVYGFQSLLAFKAKFQPRYRPLYLAYPDPISLPAIGYAISHAYLPHLTPAAATRLVRRVARR